MTRANNNLTARLIERVDWRVLVALIFACILGAVIWPFVYPILDFLLSLLNLSDSLILIGALYGEHSETAPGFFKGMAEARQQLSGEDPYLASLSYGGKAKLLASITIPIYLLEAVIFVLVALISLLSRVIPWRPIRYLMQSIGILIAILPFIVVSLWCLAFFILAYIQAWQSGLLDFAFVVLIWPAVVIRVVSAWVGVFLLAFGLVPIGLAFAGPNSLVGRFLPLRLPEETPS